MSIHRLVNACVKEPETARSCGPVEIAVAQLDLEAEPVDALSAWLSAAELARARRCRVELHRRRFIVARARLRESLALRLDTEPAMVEFAYGAYGKPRLGDRHARSGWHFNLSHCAGIAVYAFSRRRRVGIDVEAVRPLHGADAIAAIVFSRSEQAAYRSLAAHERPLGFFNCWTRKEAFVKALGAGTARSYDRFDVSLAPGQPARILRVDARSADSGWHLDSFAPAEGFVAALVSERGEYLGPTSPERNR
jgi:4'-phosphopantetheinyl transferase